MVTDWKKVNSFFVHGLKIMGIMSKVHASHLFSEVCNFFNLKWKSEELISLFRENIQLMSEKVT